MKTFIVLLIGAGKILYDNYILTCQEQEAKTTEQKRKADFKKRKDRMAYLRKGREHIHAI